MNQASYLTALKQTLRGLPADEIADILRDCKRHFMDGAAEGRGEQDIARGLGDPRQMAMELRATVRMAAYEKKSSIGNLMRLLPALAGMLSFNMFMAIPALILPLLLLSAYLLSVASALAGVVIAFSGVSGIDHVAISPQRQFIFQSADERAKAPLAPDWSSVDIGNFRVQLRLPDAPAQAHSVYNVLNLDIGPLARWTDKLRLAYGLALLVLAAGVWRGSNKMGRALLLGLANYLRLNLSLFKNADRR